MIKTLTHQAIALAGLSQAMYLVQQIAKRGFADREDLATCISSTLKIDADDVLAVYGGLDRLATGLKQLEKQLAEPNRVEPEQARYASTLMFLERQLMKQPEMLDAISSAVRVANERAEERGVLDDAVFEALAEGYQKSLSQMKQRVLVSGEQMYLSDPDNANRIRSLLLAGIRSLVLWRQCGGSRWKMLFLRPRLQRETRQLLESI
jgi:high frequency lysogenization protein